MGTGFDVREPLWYNVGVWGELGFAIPNFGAYPTTLNSTINDLVSLMGRNLQAIMNHQDADLRVPPSINTLTRIHRLILRARQIIGGRAVAPATPNMEAIHAQPAERDFLIFPTPYFKVRNPHLKEYCGLVLDCMCEAMCHTENRKAIEISTAFGGLVGQYLARVYRLMSSELFGVPVATAADPAFVLTDAMLASYDPGKFFTSTEMIDAVPAMDGIPSPRNLGILALGIPATQLVGITRFPGGATPNGFSTTPTSAVDDTTTNTAAAATTTDASAANPPAFPTAPSA